MLMRAMLVDDEPYILQGLSVIINWEEEGYEIVKKAADGQEALDYLAENEVDLIITDIRMPRVNGLELLERIRTKNISDAYVIVLSGYNDFKYAQTAIRYSCMDYLLKPIAKEQLLSNIRQASSEKKTTEQKELDDEIIRRGYLLQSLSALLQGKANENKTEYIRSHLKCDGQLRYVHIGLNDLPVLEEMSDDEVASLRDRVYDAAALYIGSRANLFREFFVIEEDYEVGFLFCESMARDKGQNAAEFFEGLYRAICSECDSMDIILLIGKSVGDISRISLSYSSACILRTFRGIKDGRSIYFYEDEMHVEEQKMVLCREPLDKIVEAVLQNDTGVIDKGVDELFEQMNEVGRSRELVNMNINYIMFRFLDLATGQDETVNQGEVLAYINANIFNEKIELGSPLHMKRFAAEYASYLVQIRKNQAGGILSDIESEIKEHFAENITLKDLGQKYYINSSYLGQIFRKRYGQSFKSYLNNCRVREAASQLIKTDKKIVEIAEDVGYHDLDYFISRFIEIYDCTPARYRKAAREE